MAEADVIRAVLAERVRLASFESARSTALAADFDTRTSGLLDTLRTLEEAARRGPLTPAQRTAAADARASLTRIMREIRASYRAGLQGDLFTVARREAGLTSATIRAEVGAAGTVPAADLQAVLARPVRGSTWFQRLDADLLGMADRVDGALLTATRRGASMTDAARLLGDALGAVEGSRGRLVRIARTEMQRVANDAASLTYRANSDVVRAVRYLATLDSRVCPVCEPLHNEVFEMDEEGGHNGPPLPQHPNCFPEGVIVSGPTPIAAMTRWYSGPLVQIEAGDGGRLSVTPNHPMLTLRGWVAAGEIEEGDHLLYHRKLQGMLSGDPDHDLAPAPIQEVARALRESPQVGAAVVPTSPEDFHGDGMNGEVHVVWPHRLLREHFQPRPPKPAREGALIGGLPPRLLHALGPPDLLLEAVGAASDSRMGGPHIPAVLLRRSCGHHLSVGAGLITQRHALPLQPLGDEGSRDAVDSRQRIDGLPSKVAADHLTHRQRRGPVSDAGRLDDGRVLRSRAPDAEALEFIAQTMGGDPVGSRDLVAAFAREVRLDRVHKVTRSQFSGHVFNLETTQGWYVANGYITHNCRCFYAPVTRSLAELAGLVA